MYNKKQALIEKVNKEIKEFRENEKKKSVNIIYDDFYKIHFFEMMAEYLQNIEDTFSYLDNLEKQEYPIKFLYANWLSTDASFTENWEDIDDFIFETFND